MVQKLEKSRFLRTINGQKTDATAIWLMRQAGRYMPCYRRMKEKYDFLQLVKNPELAVEITLSPFNYFDLDAAIIFADILPLLQAMGLDLSFVGGYGPVIHNPIKNEADVNSLKNTTAREGLDFTLQAVKLFKNEKPNMPLIGFSGAPFTLASYAIEGKSTKDFQKTKTFMLSHPEAWRKLMEKISDLIADYLIEQSRTGADALQLFDSWVGALSPQHFCHFVKPHLENIIAKIKVATATPLIYFSTMSCGLSSQLAALDVEVIGVDWRYDIKEAWKIFDDKIIQGNLDPIALFSPWPVLRRQTKDLIDSIRQVNPNLDNYIFNLGHGILPNTPMENVKMLIDFVHEETAK